MPPDVDVDALLDRLSTFEYQRAQNGEAGAEIHLIQVLKICPGQLAPAYSSGRWWQMPAFTGKLFDNSRPIRLVVDLQKMHPSDTVALNDLLDPESPALNKIRLGQSCRDTGPGAKKTASYR